MSVVIPTFNDAERLRQGLASIVRQSTPPDEIVVCDDCSTDHTHDVVLACAQRRRAIAVRYVRLDEHAGVVGARNHGIRAASGEWIAACDSDDLWLPDKLHKQRSFISAWHGRRLSILGTYGYNVSDAGRVLSTAPFGPKSEARYEAHWAARRLFYMLHSSIVFPRSCFDEVGGYSSEYGFADDIDFCTRMSDVGVVLALTEPLVHYRKRFGSLQLVEFRNKEEGRMRLATNRRRAAQNLAPLSAEEFRAERAAAPLAHRIKRKARAFGTYHYRLGAVCAANRQRVRGAWHLSLAAAFDRHRTIAGVRRGRR